MVLPINRAWPEISQAPAAALIPVTKADSDLPDGPCRGLLVGTPGTLNIKDGTGTTRTNVPIQQGWNPVECIQVRTGGTATDIWALY